MIDKIKRLKPISRTSHLLSFLIPKKQGRWVFGAWHGERFAGNSKYLYLYANQYHNDLDLIWISSNTELVEALQEKGYKAHHEKSLKGKYYCATAEKTIVTNDTRDVNKWMTGRSDLIQLWHGLPLKKILFDNDFSIEGNKIKKMLRKLTFKLYTDYDKILSTSENLNEIFQRSFKADSSRMLNAGYPRNDIFSNQIEGEEIFSQKEKIQELKQKGNKIILYAATWREYESEHELNYTRLDKQLENTKYILLVDSHTFAERNVEEDLNNVVKLEGSKDIQPILKQTDLLITDYSSIYIDFLHRDKPIIFYCYDLEKYQQKRGLNFEYEEVTPGPKAYNQKELERNIKQAINKDKYANQRKEVKKIFFDQKCGEASKMITECLYNGK